jgi:hypothetical protein
VAASDDAPGEDIRQPADVAATRPEDPEGMEIRISLDRVEPPSGSLRLVASAELPRPVERQEGEEVPFTGWLGLLRALYQVIGLPDGH